MRKSHNNGCANSVILATTCESFPQFKRRKPHFYVKTPWRNLPVGGIIGTEQGFSSRQLNGPLVNITFSCVTYRHYGLVRYTVYERHHLHLYDVRRRSDRLGIGSGLFGGCSVCLGVRANGNNPALPNLTLLRTKKAYCESCHNWLVAQAGVCLLKSAPRREHDSDIFSRRYTRNYWWSTGSRNDAGRIRCC